MSGDLLSDVLRAVRLRGALYFDVQGRSPWTAEASPAAQVLPNVMPGAEHLIEFHGVVDGACWAAIVDDDAPPVRLQARDVILFPQGDPHVLSSRPGLRPPQGGTRRSRLDEPRPEHLPYRLSVLGAHATERHLPLPRSEVETHVVCGFLGLDARPFNPLLAALPRVLHVSGATLGEDSWVAAFLRTAAAESEARRPGSEAVLDRMSEMLFAEVVRRYIASLPEDATGWLAGIHDPVVGAALALLHERPADDWTIEGLARAVAVSRSGLHERFTTLVGQPPMQYLSHWRMQLAAGLLRDTDATVAEIAAAVGYGAEAAFSRAFKRLVGAAPGTWRTGRRPSEVAATAG
ncbi:MAG: AraC family transcriptional regulator [Chloroflexi bacterium]|nr:AraC family transcriptional regulator [Chloroflexota bacterium]